MKVFKRYSVTLLISIAGCTPQLQVQQVSGYALGTTYNITYFDTELNRDIPPALDSIFYVLNKSMSTYIKNSDISKINRGDEQVVVDHHFTKVFDKSKEVFAITKGFFVPDVPPQNYFRRQLEEIGQEKCWDLLKNCDPLSTKKINFADQIRTIRALEVFYVTGKPLSALKVQKPPNWKILELGLDRDNLKERIFQRTKNMFLSGIIEETNHLISKYGFDLPILETIGYREARDILNNRSTIDKAIELTATKTIQFAKRQKTWFRNKNNPLWLNNKNLLKDAIIKIESFLS